MSDNSTPEGSIPTKALKGINKKLQNIDDSLAKSVWEDIATYGSISSMLALLAILYITFTGQNINYNISRLGSNIEELASAIPKSPTDSNATNNKLVALDINKEANKLAQAIIEKLGNNNKTTPSNPSPIQLEPTTLKKIDDLKVAINTINDKFTPDLSGKIEKIAKSIDSVKTISPSTPVPASTETKQPENVVSIKKLKSELKKEIDDTQTELSNKITNAIIPTITDISKKLDNFNKYVKSQQESNTDSKLQPIFMIVLSKAFQPQREFTELIVDDLAKIGGNQKSAISPKIIVTADGDQQRVWSKESSKTLPAWLGDVDYREIKPSLDILPTIVLSKTNGLQIQQHLVILTGHNFQLDKTKDLASWEKFDRVSFVFIEPPNLSSLYWDNFQVIQKIRKQKITDSIAIKLTSEFGDGFKLEPFEKRLIVRNLKNSLVE